MWKAPSQLQWQGPLSSCCGWCFMRGIVMVVQALQLFQLSNCSLFPAQIICLHSDPAKLVVLPLPVNFPQFDGETQMVALWDNYCTTSRCWNVSGSACSDNRIQAR